MFSAKLLKSATLLRPFSSAPKFEKTVNAITLLGRIGGEPQKKGNDDHPCVTFSLATHDNYKYPDSNDWSQRTDWHRIVVFKPALRDTVLTYLRKGQRAMVTGKVSYGELTDADGNVRVATSIIADDVIFFNQA